MATVGGNLLQRTRCYYFTDPTFPHCNKRDPGSGCDAIDGHNRIHAILGWSESCVATYPGDMANALYALEAVVRVRNASGRERTIPIGDFHRLPGDTPHIETALEQGELITSVTLPKPIGGTQVYRKVRDRASYAFALVSVAAALDMEGNRIRQARICLGGVAHMPWRAREAEALLQGAEPGMPLFRQAAEAALAGATGLEHNRFKIELAKRAVVRALETTSRSTA